MDPFRANFKHNDREGILQLSGSFNEAVELPNINDYNSLQALLIDFTGVTYTSSIGIGVWVRWVGETQKDFPNLVFIFRNCPYVVVKQMSMIEGFIPQKIKVISFEVPFFCETCNHTEYIMYKDKVHFTLKKDLENQLILNHPTVTCSKCQQSMEIDVLEDKYFSFLN